MPKGRGKSETPTTRRGRSGAEIRAARGPVRSKLHARTDAELRAEIASNADAEPMLSDEQLANGQFVEPPNKVPVTLRVPADVLEAYRRTGRGWQTRMQEALRAGLVADAVTDPMSAIDDAIQQITRQLATLRERRPPAY